MLKDKGKKVIQKEVRIMFLGVIWEEVRIIFVEFGKIIRGKSKSGIVVFKFQGNWEVKFWRNLDEGKFYFGIFENV